MGMVKFVQFEIRVALKLALLAQIGGTEHLGPVSLDIRCHWGALVAGAHGVSIRLIGLVRVKQDFSSLLLGFTIIIINCLSWIFAI